MGFDTQKPAAPMPFTGRHLCGVLLVLALLPLAAAHKSTLPPGVDERTRALQALSRLTFGARPGDLEHLLGVGVERWIDQQLHPQDIDDSSLISRLSAFRTLRMSRAELIRNFPPPARIRDVAQGREELPHDPEIRAIYEDQLVRYRAKDSKADDRELRPIAAGDFDERLAAIIELPPAARIPWLLRLSPEERVGVLEALKGDRRERLLAGMSDDEREVIMAMDHPQQVIRNELIEAKILRATYGERQLEEVMTDFWLNHFNVFLGKGLEAYELDSYEHDVLRPRALGRFEDLLVATARSPAMLFYLDNWLSVGPASEFATGIGRSPQRRGARLPAAPRPSRMRQSGLNENYGRELLELHTLGVDGGYTQKDVTEVAKVFTGWTLKQPREGGGFCFDPRKHQPGPKYVLGHKIHENGEKEGLEVLHILARHPATAHFISTKLAMRFVSDKPPRELVERMAKSFLKTKGDIREVLNTMLRSPEFWAPEAIHAKVKTPLEFVVSSLRSTGAEVTDAAALARQLELLGMPLYGAQPPTGYSMKAEAWVSSSALLGRMNFAVRLAGGRIRGVQVAPIPLPPSKDTTDPTAVLEILENRILEGGVSSGTHAIISAQLEDPQISRCRLDDPPRPPDVELMEALLLGSPEFQRR